MTLVVPEVAALLESVLAARRQRAATEVAEHKALADAARTLSEDLRVSQGDACRLLGVSQQAPATAPVSTTAPPGLGDCG